MNYRIETFIARSHQPTTTKSFILNRIFVNPLIDNRYIIGGRADDIISHLPHRPNKSLLLQEMSLQIR